MPQPSSAFTYQKLKAGSAELAWRQDGKVHPTLPGILFLPGFFSDMTGTKASFLAEKCMASGRLLTRFDYNGHGFSSGRFIDGTIGAWLDDSLRILDEVTQGPQILVGSSMGGWMMLLLALKRPQRVAGLAGIAAAPDFTEELVWKKLSKEQQREIEEKGFIHEPSEYQDTPIPITLKLIEDGRKHLLLDKPIAVTVPVRLLQGMQDIDVPYEYALRLLHRLQSEDVRVTLVKGGDHRLSSPAQLELLWRTIEGISHGT